MLPGPRFRSVRYTPYFPLSDSVISPDSPMKGSAEMTERGTRERCLLSASRTLRPESPVGSPMQISTSAASIRSARLSDEIESLGHACRGQHLGQVAHLDADDRRVLVIDDEQHRPVRLQKVPPPDGTTADLGGRGAAEGGSEPGIGKNGRSA